MSEDYDDFGVDDAGGVPEGAKDGTTGKIIPFSRLRPDEKTATLWTRERDAINKAESKSYRFPGPIDALDEMIARQKLPEVPWPGAWSELAKRTTLYTGEMMGIAGPSGGGKTSFAIQIGRAACAMGLPVVWLPLELDPVQINLRLIGNITRQHVSQVRTWDRDSMQAPLSAVADKWHYVDRARDVNDQLDACRHAVRTAFRVFRRPPVLFVDYVGKLARGAKDPRLILADAIDGFLKIAEGESCYVVLLSQTSRGNNAVLSGKVDLENATDAIGVSAETAELEHAASVNIALNVFKADDADTLDAHILVTKARGTGREGRQGFAFHKPGGFWEPLDHLPATPNEVAVEVRRNTKKGQPVPEPKTTRADLNHKREGEASARRRDVVLAALKRSGAIGMGTTELRKLAGAGSAKRLGDTLLDLVRTADIESIGRGKWRVVLK